MVVKVGGKLKGATIWMVVLWKEKVWWLKWWFMVE